MGRHHDEESADRNQVPIIIVFLNTGNVCCAEICVSYDSVKSSQPSLTLLACSSQSANIIRLNYDILNAYRPETSQLSAGRRQNVCIAACSYRSPDVIFSEVKNCDSKTAIHENSRLVTVAADTAIPVKNRPVEKVATWTDGTISHSNG